MATVSPTPQSESATSKSQPTSRPASKPSSQGGRPDGRTLIRTIVSVVLVVVSLVIGAGIFKSLASMKEAPPRREVAERSYNVETFVVGRTTVREVITGFGTAVPDRQVTLSAEVSGLVTEVHPNLEVGVEVRAPEGIGGGDQPSGVTTGDELLKIDPATYLKRVEGLNRQIDRLTAERDQLKIEKENNERLLKTQQANLETAKAELDSKQRTKAAGAGNATQLRTAEFQVRQYEAEVVRLSNAIGLIPARVDALDAQIASAETDLATAEIDLRRTTIVPPFDGVLSAVDVELGQRVGPGDRLVEITDLNRIEIPIALTLSQYARLEPMLERGETPLARLAENESDEPRWNGRVVRVAPVADGVTRTVDVFVEVENSEQDVPLLPGTFVHVRIDGPTLPETMIIPRDVVLQGAVYVVRQRSSEDKEPTTDDAGDNGTANTATESSEGVQYIAKEVEIDVDRNVQSLSIVAGGLEVGDEIVMTNLDVVHDGALVVPQSQVSIGEELARQRTPTLKIVDP